MSILGELTKLLCCYRLQHFLVVMGGGQCLLSTDGGAVPQMAQAEVARVCSSYLVISVGALPAVRYRDLSQWGWPPKGSFFLVSGLGSRPGLLSDGLCARGIECLGLCVHIWRWEGQVLLSFLAF